MRKPDESLDDFSVKPVTGPASKPPREVSLQLTGDVQTLKPLTDLMAAETNQHTIRPNLGKQPIWFRRVIAVGSGAIVMVAIVLVSAIFVGISDPAAAPEVAMNVLPDLELSPTDAPSGFDSFSLPGLAPPAEGGGYVTRSDGGRKSGRRSIRVAQYKRRLMSPASTKSETPKFVPTTLVIYAENGVIKRRIEPWL